MKYFLNVLQVPIEFQLKQWDNSKLRDNMWLTAEPLYKHYFKEFEELIYVIQSDYRQYSPFNFKDGIKKSENWSNENQNLLILDVDDGMSIGVAKQEFKDYKYLIATTKSHQVEKKGIACDRFRVILSATNIPRGDDYFKAMRALERKYPFIDEQVNTKTGAFLGFFECEYFYNDGIDFDLAPLLESAFKLEEINKVFADTQKSNRNTPNKQDYSKSDDLPIEKIKSLLSREIVADIVSDCGYPVDRKFMFKYRVDERTPSASISSECLIKDFGSDLSTDAIGFVMEAKRVQFLEAVEIVGGYVNVTI